LDPETLAGELGPAMKPYHWKSKNGPDQGFHDLLCICQKQHGVITHQSDFRAISSALVLILIKLGESHVVFKHFVLWKLEPFSGDGLRCPKYEDAEDDCGYNSNNCVDHWPCASLCPLSYMLWTYFTSKRRSSSLRRLFHAGMELPGIP
jgi:hypothetical protein